MKLDEETKRLLKCVVDHFDQEDRPVREAQLRRYRRLKLYWNSFSQIYWSESARDYRIYASEEAAGTGDQDYYDRPVNVFRAFLETIIAALSIQIPAVSCVPDDADNPADLSTARAGDKIAELIYKHNDVVYYWLHALYVYYTEGMVAAYVYDKESKEYGEYQEKQYKDEEVESFVCPHCQSQLDDAVMSGQMQLPMQNPEEQKQFQVELGLKNDEAEAFSALEMDEYGPDDEDVSLHEQINEFSPACPECGAILDKELQKVKLVVPRFVGTVSKPKGRICLDVYGGLYVKTANYAKRQCDTPYLIWSYETHYSNALEKYPDLADEIDRGGKAPKDPFDQMARLNPQYRNAFPEDQVTIRESWLRPSSFHVLGDESDVKKLKKKFPDGVKVCMVNELVADACNEALDDCWTLTEDPMHDFINHDPSGELLVNIQDIVNDLISLVLQTIEHGIPQTWADPAVVNFESQSQIEAAPGVITPTKLQGGAKNISESFFSTKSSSLSPEVFEFYQIINQLGQFVSAAMPSIFGGSQDSGSSRTASEYSMSRTASLQRLQTTWRMLTIWWKNIFGKAIPAYMKIMKNDERLVQKDENGNFINVYIRKSEVTGKIGSVELNASEQIPISDEQKADVVMKLFELNNMELMQAIMSPENLPSIRKIIKMPEFKIPGEDDRQQQYEEIQVLMEGEPIVIPPDPMMVQQAMMQGMDPNQIPPQELPSVEIDELIDNHQIGAAICRSWLVSEAGRLAKVEKPQGYKNVMLHMKAHLTVLQMNQMGMPPPEQQQPPQQQGQQAGRPPQSSEISEGQNVRTPIE